MATFVEPTAPLPSEAAVFAGYLDYFRNRVLEIYDRLPAPERRRSRLPSGWTPAELVKHLTFVELRWLTWGFEGEEVARPWADRSGDRWHVRPDETDAELTAALRQRGEQTGALIARRRLDAVGRPGPRWEGASSPTLRRVLFHLLQEYARHVGHLDIVAELAGGATGE